MGHHVRVAVCLLLSGCVAFPWDDPALLAAADVGPEGAHIEGDGITLDVPPGALERTEHISISISDAPILSADTALSPVFHFEPSGLTFAAPVRVAIEIPDGLGGALLWSRVVDENEYDFAGFAEAGWGVALSDHFSNCGATSQCGPPPSGSPCASGPDGRDRCRSLCYCEATGPDISGYLCPHEGDPTNTICRVDPELPNNIPERQFVVERSGIACTGYRSVEVRVNTCTCSSSADGAALCPIPYVDEDLTMAGVHWGCHSTFSNPRARIEPHPPLCACAASNCTLEGNCCTGEEASVCPSYQEEDRATRSWIGVDTQVCQGFTVTGEMRTDGVMDCNEDQRIGNEWQSFPGMTTGCGPLDWPSGTPPVGRALSDEDQTRCRLTAAEWNELSMRRADCNVLARRTDAAERASIDAGESVQDHTLAILRVATEPSGSFTELTGLNEQARGMRGPMCPPLVDPIPDYQGIGNIWPTEESTLEMSVYATNNSTAGHAEGNALLQLAAQRGRTPPPGNGVPGSNFGAEGGRTEGCGELLVDRSPCSATCAVEGIDYARRTSGLDRLIVRSPAGCFAYEDSLVGANGRPGTRPCTVAEGREEACAPP